MENLTTVNEESIKNISSKRFKSSMKRLGKAAFGTAEMGAGFLGSFLNPVVGVPVTLDGILRLASSISNTKSNKSIIAYNDSKMFSKVAHVGENDITQSLGNILDILKPLAIKDKKTFLLTQELNFLLGAEKYNEDGTKKVFNTRSQGITRQMLKRAEKEGLIENFTCTETDKGRLVIEKVLMGNLKPKTLFKKERKFLMSFSISDKNVTEEQILKFLNLKDLDDKVFKIVRDKEGNIKSVNYRQIEAIKQRVKSLKVFSTKNALKENSTKLLDEPKMDIEKVTTLDSLKKDVYSKDEIAKADISKEKVAVKEENSIDRSIGE